MNRKGGSMKFNFFKSLIAYLACGILVFNLLGCAKIKETVKGISGVSTKILEDNRESAIRKEFNYDYNTCYNKIKKILKAEGCYIYSQELKKHLIAVYLSQEDTTPVGVFFREIDSEKTEVEVSSPSTYAKELIAERISAKLNLGKKE
jgi:nucleoside diphosphate kinase